MKNSGYSILIVGVTTLDIFSHQSRVLASCYVVFMTSLLVVVVCSF
jgi:hypothetical protein